MSEDPECNSERSNVQSSRQKKKTKKIHKKKKSRAVVSVEKDQIAIIAQFFEGNPSYFTGNSSILSERYGQEIGSNVHVRDILSKS
jgi:hypothetical protein